MKLPSEKLPSGFDRLEDAELHPLPYSLVLRHHKSELWELAVSGSPKLIVGSVARDSWEAAVLRASIEAEGALVPELFASEERENQLVYVAKNCLLQPSLSALIQTKVVDLNWALDTLDTSIRIERLAPVLAPRAEILAYMNEARDIGIADSNFATKAEAVLLDLADQSGMQIYFPQLSLSQVFAEGEKLSSYCWLYSRPSYFPVFNLFSLFENSSEFWGLEANALPVSGMLQRAFANPEHYKAIALAYVASRLMFSKVNEQTKMAAKNYYAEVFSRAKWDNAWAALRLEGQVNPLFYNTGAHFRTQASDSDHQLASLRQRHARLLVEQEELRSEVAFLSSELEAKSRELEQLLVARKKLAEFDALAAETRKLKHELESREVLIEQIEKSQSFRLGKTITSVARKLPLAEAVALKFLKPN